LVIGDFGMDEEEFFNHGCHGRERNWMELARLLFRFFLFLKFEFEEVLTEGRGVPAVCHSKSKIQNF